MSRERIPLAEFLDRCKAQKVPRAHLPAMRHATSADLLVEQGASRMQWQPAYGRSAIYFLANADGVVYVGQTRCLFKRLGQHAISKPPFSSVFFIPTDPWELATAEKRWIERLNPPWNGRVPGGRCVRQDHADVLQQRLNLALVALQRAYREQDWRLIIELMGDFERWRR